MSVANRMRQFTRLQQLAHSNLPKMQELSKISWSEQSLYLNKATNRTASLTRSSFVTNQLQQFMKEFSSYLGFQPIHPAGLHASSNN